MLAMAVCQVTLMVAGLALSLASQLLQEGVMVLAVLGGAVLRWGVGGQD
ncbi:hypothetical protein [Pseudomonas silesiensis]